ncbi:hypothetical protein MLD38_034274 [Melastoma candidum]|uniref:Uncharacterized protein n=1 Tax=Melastoma candidum TaxID=119954 RepID=A0ACB9MC04_9MYRT|nr:hypothetical protein MLD38_034274 [Melastoma candidum]
MRRGHVALWPATDTYVTDPRLSQQWLSILAAVMSCTYSTVGFIAQVIENGKMEGTISGVVTTSINEKFGCASKNLETLGSRIFIPL